MSHNRNIRLQFVNNLRGSCVPLGYDDVNNAFLGQNPGWILDDWYPLNSQDFGVYRWNGCIGEGESVFNFKMFSFMFAARRAVEDELSGDHEFKWFDAYARRFVPDTFGHDFTKVDGIRREPSRHVPTYFLNSLTSIPSAGKLVLKFDFDRQINSRMSTNISNNTISAARLAFHDVHGWGFGKIHGDSLLNYNIQTKSSSRQSYDVLPNNGRNSSYFLNQDAINRLLGRNYRNITGNRLDKFNNTLQVTNADKVDMRFSFKNNDLDYLRRLDFKISSHQNSVNHTLAPKSSLYPFRFWDKYSSYDAPPDYGHNPRWKQPWKDSNLIGSHNPRFYSWYIKQTNRQPDTDLENYIYDEDTQISFGNGFWTDIRSDTLPNNPLEPGLKGIRMISYGSLRLRDHNHLHTDYGIKHDKIQSTASAFVKIPSDGRYTFQSNGPAFLGLSRSDEDGRYPEVVQNLGNPSFEKGEVVFVQLSGNTSHFGRSRLQWRNSNGGWGNVPGDALFLSAQAASQADNINEINELGKDNTRNIKIFSNYKINSPLDHTFIEACLNKDCSSIASQDSVSNVDQLTATPNVISDSGQQGSDDLFTDYRREFGNRDLTSWKRSRHLSGNQKNRVGFSAQFEMNVLQDLYSEPFEEIRLRLGNPNSTLINRNILSLDEGRSLTIPINDASPLLSIENS